MVVIPERNVLRVRSLVQEALHVLEEPLLVPLADLVQLGHLARIHHVADHDDRALLVEDQTLDEHVGVAALAKLLVQDPVALGGRVRRLVRQLHEALRRDHLDLDGGEEAEGAVGPGHREEEVRVLLLRALDHGAVRHDEFVGEADVLEKAELVGGGLDAGAHDETADGEVVQLGEDGDRPAQLVQGVRQLAHRNERLAGHKSAVNVRL